MVSSVARWSTEHGSWAPSALLDVQVVVELAVALVYERGIPGIVLGALFLGLQFPLAAG